MLPIVNIAAYKFVELHELPNLRDRLRRRCAEHGLKGTILLSREGINLFVAGSRQGIDALLSFLRSLAELADLATKESYSAAIPFERMLVKIKREIIAFGVADVDPRRYSSRRISARELKQWLDEGRRVTLLDTRNRFEVKAGTFHGAIEIGVDDFRDFPAAASTLPEHLKDEPVVTFCTGGIRCEKAAPFLEKHGFKNVFQLDGGILKYFEECGGEHYRGDCFVFDRRVALNPLLQESSLKQCFVCQTILTPEDQQSDRYVPETSCPYCCRSEAESREELINLRHASIRTLTDPLPGSVPYENVRPLSVPLRFDGMELLDFLDAMRTHLTREQWQSVCDEGRLMCRGVAIQPGRIVRSGERLLHCMPATLEPDVNANIQILYEDEALVVVNKPAPLPMHPCGRFNRNSLSWILSQVYKPLRLRPAHRLDADTTGIVLFSKTGRIARSLQPQFESAGVQKTYLARIVGWPEVEAFECHLPISARPEEDGVRVTDEKGLEASTRFRVLSRLDDRTALVEAFPITGRTNQIRVHLWSLGYPILGDPVYLPDRKLAPFRSLVVEEKPLCLQAAAIEFDHPTRRERCRFASPLPDWADLRRQGNVKRPGRIMDGLDM